MKRPRWLKRMFGPRLSDEEAALLQELRDLYARQSQMTERPLLAGEAIVCGSGHIICRVALPMRVGEMPQPGSLADWQQPEPELGAAAKDAACAICGSLWWRGDAGLRLRTATGWWPKLAPGMPEEPPA